MIATPSKISSLGHFVVITLTALYHHACPDEDGSSSGKLEAIVPHVHHEMLGMPFFYHEESLTTLMRCTSYICSVSSLDDISTELLPCTIRSRFRWAYVYVGS